MTDQEYIKELESALRNAARVLDEAAACIEDHYDIELFAMAPKEAQEACNEADALRELLYRGGLR